MPGAPPEDHVQVDPAESLMREVGAQLRQRRLERGEDLEDVAKSLRIKPSYLFALEQGDLSALPGRPYALGFLRSYADHLGFDGEDLVSRIKATVADLTDRTRLRIRMPLPENRLPKAPVMVISLAVVVGVYAGWSYMYQSSRMAVDTVAEVPADLRERTIEATTLDADEEGAARAAVSGGALEPQGSSGSASAEPAGASAAAEAPGGPLAPQAGPSGQAAGGVAVNDDRDGLAVHPAAGGDPAEPVGAEAPVGGPAPAGRAAPDQAPAATGNVPGNSESVPAALEVLALLDPAAGGPRGPQVHGRGNADARVILRARQTAWIQVSSPSGDYTFTRTLQPGEALLVPNRADLELWTGNAGGLEVIVDGTAVPALARGGSVQRHVSLDPDRLLAAADERP